MDGELQKSFQYEVPTRTWRGMRADKSAIAREIPRIELIIMTYAPHNVWNADALGFFYRQPSAWTLSNGPVSGFKK